MVKNTYLTGSEIVALLENDTEKLNLICAFSNALDKNSNPKFKFADLNRLSFLKTEKLANALPLAKTKVPGENIYLIAKNASAEFIKNAANIALDLEENVYKDRACAMSLTKDKYDEKEFNITSVDVNGNKYQILLSDKGETEAISRSIKHNYFNRREGRCMYYTDTTTVDYRNNTTSKIRTNRNNALSPFEISEIRISRDDSGKVLKTEYIRESEVEGVLDILVKTPDGKTKIISSGKYDPKTGITTVKKDMTSLNGTRTEYLYEDDKNGNRISEYKITDKNGKVLLNKNSTFEVINENKFISSNNGDTYEIVVDNENLEIKVTNLNNPKSKATVNIDRKLQGNREKLLTSLKAMPGEELIKLAQSTKVLEGIDNPRKSQFLPFDKTLTSSDNLFVALHELGHARDHRDKDKTSLWGMFKTRNAKTLHTDKELIEIFEKEKANFNKAFSIAQRDHIDYFMNTLNHYNGKEGGLKETIAESNAILTTPRTLQVLEFRTHYLQQYFPETIAKISQLASVENSKAPAVVD